MIRRVLAPALVAGMAAMAALLALAYRSAAVTLLLGDWMWICG